MATGLPVVTFDTPVSREFLGELGNYATYGSARSLADRLKELLSDDAGRVELGRKIREKAEQDLGRHVTRRELEAVYQEAFKRIGRAAPKTPAELGVAADSGHDSRPGREDSASANPFDLPEVANGQAHGIPEQF
jgi:hypothetical protein